MRTLSTADRVASLHQRAEAGDVDTVAAAMGAPAFLSGDVPAAERAEAAFLEARAAATAKAVWDFSKRAEPTKRDRCVGLG